jgi:hypothetical protein
VLTVEQGHSPSSRSFALLAPLRRCTMVGVLDHDGVDGTGPVGSRWSVDFSSSKSAAVPISGSFVPNQASSGQCTRVTGGLGVLTP